jgi:signal transduction histidine kinase
VLAVTYLIVARDTSSQTRHLRVGGTRIQLPRSPLTVMTRASAGIPSGGKGETMVIEQIHVSPSGKETITWAPARSASARAAGARRTVNIGSATERENQRYAACLRGNGVPDYPNPGVRPGGGAMTLRGDRVSVNGQALSERWPAVMPATAKCQKYIAPSFGPRYTAAQMTKIRAGALAMSRCMRARGLDYPNLEVAHGPSGYGVALGFPHGLPRYHNAATSRRFTSANVACSKLLNASIPAHPAKRATVNGLSSSVQRQLNVVIERANGALTTQRSRSLRILLAWSGVALGVMAVISMLLGWLVAGRALRPLRRMTTRARRITEENLHERLSVDTQEDELGELATTFDGVLTRLGRAFDAQRRFVANASHELRTPVTVERALLEIALSDPDTDAETLRRTCERVLASTRQQQQMIEALLTLARSQGGSDVDAPADLAELAEDAIALRERRLGGLTLATDLHPAPLHGDPALLERLVANLIDNAIIHNLPADAWITVETGADDAGSWLRVSNSGPEVPEGMIPELFEPFRRMDGERTATATGVGLGLSIVRAIADVHGAELEAGPVRGGGLRVQVRF